MDGLDYGGNSPPLFFQPNILEKGKDETERKLEQYLHTVKSMSSGKSEREAIDALQLHISQGHYEEVQLGLFSLILTSTGAAQKVIFLESN